jgi:hypothetical protein
MGRNLIKQRIINNEAISPIALGTMRFADKGTSIDELVALFSLLYNEGGINVHHSSYEYASYALYCNAIASFKKKVVAA